MVMVGSLVNAMLQLFQLFFLYILTNYNYASITVNNDNKEVKIGTIKKNLVLSMPICYANNGKIRMGLILQRRRSACGPLFKGNKTVTNMFDAFPGIFFHAYKDFIFILFLVHTDFCFEIFLSEKGALLGLVHFRFSLFYLRKALLFGIPLVMDYFWLCPFTYLV